MQEVSGYRMKGLGLRERGGRLSGRRSRGEGAAARVSTLLWEGGVA